MHLRSTRCSILLHLIDICFLPCICLWQISQIQTCLCVVVGPGFVSTSPSFMRNRVNHPAGPHDRLAQNFKSEPHCWRGEVSTHFAQQFVTALIASPLVGCVCMTIILHCLHIFGNTIGEWNEYSTRTREYSSFVHLSNLFTIQSIISVFV